MTPAQTSLYWRAWQRACRAAGWPALESDRLTPMGLRVIEVAASICKGVKPTADELRHACHILALGRDRSSKQFTNADLDRVLTCFKLVASDTDVAAVIRWDHPEQDQVKRLLWAIGHSGHEEAYVRHISVDKFGQADWQNLSLEQLRHLALTLRERAKARSRKKLPDVAMAVATATAESNKPF